MKKNVYLSFAVAIFGISLLSNEVLAQSGTDTNGAKQVTTDDITNVNNEANNIVENDTTALPQYEQLADIVITAERPMVKTDGATLTYDVREDPAAAGLSVLDLLRKVPQVSVDAQDNIRLNGKSDYKLYVNGHEDISLSQNASTILKMMPAEAIQKVEVITEPGSKYDAEGSAGIINLVINQQADVTDDGTTATISLNLNNRQLAPGVNLRFKKNKVTASVNAVYAHSLMSQSNLSDITVDYFNNPEISKMLQQTSQNIKFDYYMLNTAMSWEPDTKNLFNFSANFNFVDGSLKDGYNSSSAFDYANILLWREFKEQWGGIKNLSFNTQGAYRHNFDDAGKTLTATYSFNFGRNPLKIENLFTEYENITPSSLYQSDETINFDRTHTIQIDYNNPFSETQILEAGVKGTFQRNSAFGNTFTGNSAAESLLAYNSYLAQFKDIMAAYLGYTGIYNKLTTKAGIRYEGTRMGINYAQDPEQNFSKYLNDVVPNAALVWNFSPVHNIRLAYQMRIARPNISQVNPYEMTYYSNMIQTGNPDLESQHENKISLTYTQFAGNLGGNIGIDYSKTSNVIDQYTYLSGDKIIETWDNLGNKSEIGLNGFLMWSIIKGMNLQVSGRVAHYSYNCAAVDLHRKDWTGNYNINYSYSLPYKIQLSAYGGQGIGWASAYDKSSGWYYYGLGISKSFLANDALKISLNAGNFFTDHQIMHITSTTPDMKKYQRVEMHNWTVGLNLSWTIGKLKANVKEIDVDTDLHDSVESQGKKFSSF